MKYEKIKFIPKLGDILQAQVMQLGFKFGLFGIVTKLREPRV